MDETITRIEANGHTGRRSARFLPSSFNEADNSLEVIWTTGAAVTRMDYYDGEFYDETLRVDAKSIRLSRLNEGGPVLAAHNDRDLAALCGSVVPGTVRLEDGKGYARIRLAATPDVADIVAKVKDGHLRSVSVAYMVHTYQRIEKPNGARDELRAIDWEPTEISLVSVPADPGARIRSRSNDMADEIEDEGGTTERTRAKPATIARIRALCSRTDDLSRTFERELIEDHTDRPLTEREVLARISDELVTVRAQPSVDTRLSARAGGGQGDMSRAIEDALYARLGGSAPSDQAREFMGASMADLARGLMEQRGERVRWESPSKLMQRMGQHTTSDFPNLLQAATARYLNDLYSASPSPLKKLARKRLVPDFRQITALSMLPVGMLRKVVENAEFKRVSIAEGTNGYKLATFGEIFGMSRQAFINDDLGYFSDLGRMWARAAVETEAAQLVGLITGNGPTLDDGQPLYSAAHGNLSATSDAITTASLSAARIAMWAQKNPDGTPANVPPRYLVVGPAKQTEAEALLNVDPWLPGYTSFNSNAKSTYGGETPNSTLLTLIVDPRITGNSWRLFTDPSNWPVLEYANLQGQEGLFTDTRIGFSIDGFEFKARIDFGAGVVDYRGTYKNPGA
jgi:HK97 family phage prohead protease